MTPQSPSLRKTRLERNCRVTITDEAIEVQHWHNSQLLSHHTNTFFSSSEFGADQNSIGVCLFTVSSGNQSYQLRGFSHNGEGKINLYADNMPFNADIFDWVNATIRYSLTQHPSIGSYNRLNFNSGMPCPAFTATITVE